MLDFPYTKVQGISPIPVVNLYLQNYENSLLTATFDCAILDTVKHPVGWALPSMLILERKASIVFMQKV
jgi:hypothetical protein